MGTVTDRALWDFAAIGTQWQVETNEPLPPDARAAVEQAIGAFDAAWSRFRPDSLVSRLAAHGGRAPAPADTAVLLDTFAEVSRGTDGAVNPLVGDALARRGYGPDYSFVDGGATPAPADWTDRLTWSDDTIGLAGPATIDVGALGKGRLVDIVLATLEPFAGPDIVVDASGDLAVRGRPQRIGLEDPYDPHRAIGALEVTDAALCASATNRRQWGEGLHHVLDARTGEPVRTIVATWAMAPTAIRADAVATALFFEGGPRLAHAWGVPWVRMTTTGAVEWSPGCPVELFR